MVLQFIYAVIASPLGPSLSCPATGTFGTREFSPRGVRARELRDVKRRDLHLPMNGRRMVSETLHRMTRPKECRDCGVQSSWHVYFLVWTLITYASENETSNAVLICRFEYPYVAQRYRRTPMRFIRPGCDSQNCSLDEKSLGSSSVDDEAIALGPLVGRTGALAPSGCDAPADDVAL